MILPALYRTEANYAQVVVRPFTGREEAGGTPRFDMEQAMNAAKDV